MYNVNVVNRINCFCLIFFLFDGIAVAFASLATPLASPCNVKSSVYK